MHRMSRGHPLSAGFNKKNKKYEALPSCQKYSNFALSLIVRWASNLVSEDMITWHEDCNSVMADGGGLIASNDH